MWNSQADNHAASMVRTRDGVDLFIRDWGRGAPVLLLAGWAMSSDLWGPVMLHLNDARFRTIAYDRRGHGRSSDPGVVDYDRLADDLAVVIEGRGLTDLTIVAHSGAGGRGVALPHTPPPRSGGAPRRRGGDPIGSREW